MGDESGEPGQRLSGTLSAMHAILAAAVGAPAMSCPVPAFEATDDQKLAVQWPACWSNLLTTS